jgi:predicted AAA+ superfamily ATPase
MYLFKHKNHIDRKILSVALERMREEPVILLQGPRSAGKSTLLRQIAVQAGGTLIDLDDPPTRQAALNDPSLLIDVPGPVLIDEYRHAPDVLSAIKARLNEKGAAGGQFALAGSARHESLPKAAEALTGRLHQMQVLPFSQAELAGTRAGLIPALFDTPKTVPGGGLSATTREDYIARIVAGGFPLALARATPVSRARWFDDYVRATLAKDVAALGKLRQAQALPRVLTALAGQTAQIMNVSHIARRLQLENGLIAGYVHLLEAVFLIRALPAWGKTLTARSAASPKVHMLDSGVAARLLRLSPEKLLRRDAASLTELGHLVETFAVGELLKEAACLDDIAEIGHWRTHDGHEVDLVIERGDGEVVAFEIKAGTGANAAAFHSLARLRDLLGTVFRAGVVFHMGTRAHHYDDRLMALPLDRLWRP